MPKPVCVCAMVSPHRRAATAVAVNTPTVAVLCQPFM